MESAAEGHAPQYLRPSWGRVRAVLLLRLTLVIATSYLLWAHSRALLVSGATPWLVLAALLSNIGLYYVPPRIVDSARFATFLVVVDTLWVTGVLLLSGALSADFFVIYFFVLFLAAISENLRLMTLGTVLVSLAYLYVVYTVEGSAAFSSASLIRVPFFFAVAALYGFFADRVRRERQRSNLLLATALEDTLTQMPNRRGLERLLDDAISRSARTGRQLAVLLIDIDHFKYINDSYGHLVGDDTLLAIASRLSEQVRRIDGFGRMAALSETEPTGRLGGDEFGLILTEVSSIDQVVQVAQRVCDVAAKPIPLDDLEIRITVSIGISIFPSAPDEPIDMSRGDWLNEIRRRVLSEADRALYTAKSAGRNTFCFHDPQMDREANTRIKLAGGLRLALDRDEFRLAYQPQVDLKTLTISSVEALLRWEQPHGEEQAGPAEFIPIAETTGQVRAIGEWVLRTACRDMSRWQKLTGKDMRVAVNMSAVQFRDPRLFDEVEQILAESELPGELLELELTETVLLRSTPAVRDTILGLHERLGVMICLDDVGRGFSSLEHLCRMPLDKMKVDRSFVLSSISDPASRVVVSAIVALGLKLGLEVVAEGVETEEQLELLRQERCTTGQGYLFSRPVSPERLTRFFERHGRTLAPENWSRLSG